MNKKKPLDKEQRRERRNRMLDTAAAARLSLTEGVREMRAIAAMTQDEFARHRGVSARVIKAIELDQANPTVATLNQIGDFFGLEVAFVPKQSTSGTASSTGNDEVPDVNNPLQAWYASEAASRSPTAFMNGLRDLLGMDKLLGSIDTLNDRLANAEGLGRHLDRLETLLPHDEQTAQAARDTETDVKPAKRRKKPDSA